ncbi:MAG TPA: hypothetical protein DIV79_10405 [Opitutae bacterium]|nr:hypothetical protein [Opitutae bacterium]
MRAVSEFIYFVLDSLPPAIKDTGLILWARNRLRHREVLRRTRPLVTRPAYRKKIESQEFRVIFVSPIYKSFPVLAVSLLEQTYENWELLFIHDGPSSELGELERNIIASDNRIRFFETKSRANDWGHTPRQKGFEQVSDHIAGEFIVVSNSDNYHVPGYIEKMLEAFDDTTDAVYCNMSHDYYSWRNFDTRLEYSFIDCGCVMARREIALAAGWNDNSYEGDWKYVSDLIDQCGKERMQKLDATLFVHS